MSDTSLLQHRKSLAQEPLPEEPPRSKSLPTLTKPDVVTLYTTPTEGVPSLLVFVLRLVRDFLTFFIRAGLSTMMFIMDLTLRLFVFVTEIWLQIPGAFLISFVARFIVWSFQTIIWFTYITLELFFYLPAPLLMVYVLAIGFLYYKMPEAVEALLHSIWLMVEYFAKIVAYITFPSYRKS